MKKNYKIFLRGKQIIKLSKLQHRLSTSLRTIFIGGLRILTILLLLAFKPVIGQNPISAENLLTGNPSSEWDISGAGDMSIQGFGTQISVNRGETIYFKIKTDATAYTVKIYRIGYYQGNGARYQGDGVISATLPQIQPTDL